MNNQQYELSEAIIHSRYTQSIDRAPLAERKESQADALNLMRDPETLTRLTGYMLDGNYGYHPHKIAREIAENVRMNRTAALTALVCLYECRTPNANTRAAWHQLTASEQTAANAAVMTAITEYLENKEG
jgi:hypothetical protein